MEGKVVLVLHGFASSAQSAKAQYLAEKSGTVPDMLLFIPDFNPAQKDFEYLTVTGMINRLRQYLIDHNIAQIDLLVGSSLGCLVAMQYAFRFGGVKRLLLLAPVISYEAFPCSNEMLRKWEREGVTDIFHYRFGEAIPLRYGFHQDGLLYSKKIPPPADILILHGRKDDIIPIDLSRQYALEYPDKVKMEELDSDHGLLDCLDLIWKHTCFLLGETG